MSTRIYLVTDTETNKHFLIHAGNQSQDIQNAAQMRFDIEIAGQDDLVSLLSHGIPVEFFSGLAMTELFEELILVNHGGTD